MMNEARFAQVRTKECFNLISGANSMVQLIQVAHTHIDFTVEIHMICRSNVRKRSRTHIFAHTKRAQRARLEGGEKVGE